MTQEIAEVTRWHVNTMAFLIGASFLSTLFGFFGTWSFWRARRLLAALPLVEERLAALSTSVSLLTDTTEACFKAVSIQLEGSRTGRGRPNRVSEAAPTASRSAASKSRQRRVIGAARRGEAIAEIAAREALAEGEVALRIKVPERQEAGEPYGNLLS